MRVLVRLLRLAAAAVRHGRALRDAVKPQFSSAWICGALGVVLVLASICLPWFTVPKTVTGAPAAAATVTCPEAPATLVFRVVSIVLFGASAALLLRGRQRRPEAARLAAVLLGALVLYPHAVMVWCPETAANASWLRQEHESLVLTRGDLLNSGDTKAIGWKDRVYTADIADEAAVLPTPALEPKPAPFGSLRELLEWFGYSSSFCLFARAGWGLALAGSVLWLAGLCSERGGPDLACALGAIRAGTAFLAMTVGVALVPAGLCAFEMESARDAAERGLFALALERIHLATRVLPVLAQNGEVIDQVGLLQEGLGLTTAEESLHRAKMAAVQGRFEQADAEFAAVLRIADATPAVRREALRALLRRGIREVNAGESPNAVQTLEAVLEADPCNVKANFVLQIADLRAGRFVSVAETAARMRKVYRYFNTLTKLPVLGASQENVAYAAYLRDDPVAAHLAWKKLADPKWLRNQP